jgi:hypothetical protein
MAKTFPGKLLPLFKKKQINNHIIIYNRVIYNMVKFASKENLHSLSLKSFPYSFLQLKFIYADNVTF